MRLATAAPPPPAILSSSRSAAMLAATGPLMLACPSQAIGVDLDLVEKGLGVRSRRYAMLVDNGVVRSRAI